MHLSMLSPRVGGGETHGKLTRRAFRWVGILTFWVLAWGREFDIATICFGQKAEPRGGKFDSGSRENVKFPWVYPSPPPHPGA